jgi:DNA-binding Xre family transcriptional regulator
MSTIGNKKVMTRKSTKKTEKEKLIEIRKAAIEEVKKMKKEGKTITTNAVEVICKEEDIFHKKSKRK